MRLRTWSLLAWLAACGHSAPPAETVPAADLPPLPPPSSTAIGLLRDNAQPLELRPEQTARLEELDAKLAEVDAPLQDQLSRVDRPLEDPTQKPERPAAGRRGGGGGGGGGGRRYGGGGGGGGREPSAEKQAATSAAVKEANTERARQARELQQKLAANEADYLSQALQLLDEAQRARAVELLSKHGFHATP